ncbi:uncharacterized protein N7483_011572 [Penicillium malachiteum]|uniref:uncharacterized protein n=1 Tax=Penicillium malachiteum TaxID=1324776 RepID=UPI002546E7A7|nr:uncharacterized protein N7483_011572 [Penicillium malachiteum]KAJ5714391.1 hypothetical protein N7483_011572 [Penicillium malachiteum]
MYIKQDKPVKPAKQLLRDCINNDLAAKDAAKDTEGATSDLSSAGPRLATCARRLVRDRTGRPNHRLVDVPAKKNLDLFKGLSKPYTSILVHIRSMRIGLKHFLYKIKEVDSDQCGCGEGSQTPRHVLIQCPLHTEIRKDLFNKLSKTDLRPGDLDYETIISHPQATRYVAEFMIKTGILGQFRTCEVEPEPDPEDTEPLHRNRPEGPGSEDAAYTSD